MIRLTSLKAARNVRPAIGSAASIAEIIENRRRAEMVAEILFGLFGDRLEGAYAQMDAAQWNSDHHPRGKGGRFVAKGTAAEVDEARKVVAKVLRGDTDVDPVDTGRHLSRLNVRQLRDLHREHGQKIRKTHLRQQIVDRVRETATGSQWYGQATQPKPTPAALPAVIGSQRWTDEQRAAKQRFHEGTRQDYKESLHGQLEQWSDWQDSDEVAAVHSSLRKSNPSYRALEDKLLAISAKSDYEGDGYAPEAEPIGYKMELMAYEEAMRRGIKPPANASRGLEYVRKNAATDRDIPPTDARQKAMDRQAARAAAQIEPTPAAGGFKPVAVPGEQMGLFSTEEVKTGQKQLFNIARDSKRGGGSAATPERSTLEKIADEHKQRSFDNAPLAGQKTIGGVDVAQPSREEIQRAVDSVQKLGNSYNPGGTHPGMYPTRAEAVAKAINSERAKAAAVPGDFTPVDRIYTPLNKIDSPAQGVLNQAKAQQAAAWKRIQHLREQRKRAGVTGNFSGLTLELMRAEEDHRRAKKLVSEATATIERRANELGTTTKRPTPTKPTPEQDRPADPIKTAAAIAKINQKHGDGLTEADAVPASMQKPSDAAKSILRTTPKKKAAAEPRQSRSSAELADAAATLSRELKRSPATVEKTLRDALAFHTQSIAEREAAKAHARKVTGLNAGNLAKFENSMRDHSTAFNWDRKARAVAMEVPELGLDPDGHDTPAKVWDLIREGKAARPSANDPEVISTAREWLSKPRRPKTTPADVPADNGFDVVFGDAAEPTRVKRGRVKDSSGVGYVPFSRARAGGANRIGSALVAALAAGRLAKPPTLHAGRFRDMGTNVGICRLRAKSAKRTRTFKGVAYTGGVMHPSITIDGVTRAMDVVLDLDSLTIPSMVRPVLDDHDETTHGLIGQTRLIRREGQRLVIEGTLYGWKLRAKEIIAAARAGHQWQLSVGTDGFRLEDIPAGQRVTVNGQTFVGPVKVARGAYLTDFSFVAVGADDHTSAVIAASRGRRPRRPRRSERDEFCTVAT